MSSITEDAVDYDNSDEPGPLELDFNELMYQASRSLSRRCHHLRKVTNGRYHEIFILYFSSDEIQQKSTDQPAVGDEEWSCIARVSRQPESVEKLMSEIETMRLVKSKTSIPVPEVYYFDFEIDNKVGAQYMLLEKLPGRHLYKMWDQLSLDDKKIVLVDIANVLAQLSSLRFDQIGCIQAPGVVGPLLYKVCVDEGWKETTGSSGPFQSTIDYLQFFRSLRSGGSEIYTDVKAVLDSYLSIHGCFSPLVPPFRLIHADFDAQNLLFTGGPSSDDGREPFDTTPVRLSGVLDWEYAFIGPLYFLYEYPIFIQDSDDNKGAYEHNAVLRPHFIRALLHSFPKGSKERADVRLSMDKNYVLKWFYDVFVVMGGGLGPNMKMLAEEYVKEVRDGTGVAYQGRADYTPDDIVLSDDEINK